MMTFAFLTVVTLTPLPPEVVVGLHWREGDGTWSLEVGLPYYVLLDDCGMIGVLDNKGRYYQMLSDSKGQNYLRKTVRPNHKPPIPPPTTRRQP